MIRTIYSFTSWNVGTEVGKWWDSKIQLSCVKNILNIFLYQTRFFKWGFEIRPSHTIATILNVLEPPFVCSSPMPLLTHLLHTNYHNKPHSHVVTISKNMSSTLWLKNVHNNLKIILKSCNCNPDIRCISLQCKPDTRFPKIGQLNQGDCALALYCWLCMHNLKDYAQA